MHVPCKYIFGCENVIALKIILELVGYVRIRSSILVLPSLAKVNQINLVSIMNLVTDHYIVWFDVKMTNAELMEPFNNFEQLDPQFEYILDEASALHYIFHTLPKFL